MKAIVFSCDETPVIVNGVSSIEVAEDRDEVSLVGEGGRVDVDLSEEMFIMLKQETGEDC